MQPVAPVRHDDGVDHPIGLDELHQPATGAEPVLQVVVRDGRLAGSVDGASDEPGQVAHD